MDFKRPDTDEAHALAKTLGVIALGQPAIAIGTLLAMADYAAMRIEQLEASLEALARKTDPAVPEMELSEEGLAANKVSRAEGRYGFKPKKPKGKP